MAVPFTVDPVPVYAGDELIFPIYELLTGAVGSEVPQNLAAYTFSAQWRRHPSAADSIPLVVDASAANIGRFDLSATPANTRAMAGPGFWDLQGTLGAEVETFIKGQTTWESDVTRP